jgi:hypothetical protein
VRIHFGVPYLRITSSITKRAAVFAVQSRTALVITNFDKTSVSEIIYLFPFFYVGVMGPWKSIVSNCHTPSGGLMGSRAPGGFCRR